MTVFLAKTKNEITGKQTNMFVCESLRQTLEYIEQYCDFNECNGVIEAITSDGRYTKTINKDESYEDEQWVLEEIEWLKGLSKNKIQ